MQDHAIYVEKPLPALESGRVLGSIPVPKAVSEITKMITDRFWAQQVENDFSDNLVDIATIPDALQMIDWVPHHHLALLGLKTADPEHLVFTASIDEHVDNIYGLCIMWVLQSDPGMAFKSSGMPAWVHHKVGDWYLFDDRVPHEVECGIPSVPGETHKFKALYCAWCIKLEAL